jgi:LacI family transcriptional regulator
LERPGETPTIYDVAAHADVSISTVSRALNEPSSVRAATRDRVYAAVQELGFELRADAAARARKRSHRIGVRGMFTSHGSYLDRLQGILAAGKEEDCEIVVYDAESFVLHPHVIDHLAIGGWLDGIILIDVPMSQALAERLTREAFKTVLIGISRPGFSCVDVDDVEGGRLAAEYLVGRGHRHCAFLGNRAAMVDSKEVLRVDSVLRTESGSLLRTPEEERLEGFRGGLATAGIALPEEYVLTEHVLPTARAAAHHLLALNPPPTAIFACADDLAAEVLKAVKERGLRVPDDVAVMGFDDREYAEFIGLTTVRQPLVESGRVAFDLLQDRLVTRSPGATTTIMLPLNVIARDTA